MLLLKQNVILDKILNILKEKEKETSDFLNALAMERERRTYRNDILQLSSTDISLLPAYYINSNEEAQEDFSNLLKSVYVNQDEIDNFMTEFKNLYYLNKSELTTLTQYGAAKRVILDFINKLKDEVLSEKKLDKIKEKEYADKLLIIKRLIRYFSSKPGSVELKNIDNLMVMLNILNFSNVDKNNALVIVIENNVKYYNRTISAIKRKTDDPIYYEID